MANVGPIVWYCRDNAPTSTLGWSAVTAWSNGATIAAGALRRQSATPTVGNERVIVALTGGTTGGSEPAWVVTKGAKTTDNTVTWQECTGQPGVNGNTTDSPTWLQNKNTAVTLGLIIYDSGASSLQIVSTAGTTGNGSAPSFSATAGTTTADNTVTWTSLGLASGFGAWAAPFARMQSVGVTNWAAAGQSIFVGDDHSETQASTYTLTGTGTTLLPLNFYSIDHSGSLTLASAALKSGAKAATSGNFNLQLQLFAYFIGFTFSAGTGAGSQIFSFGTNAFSAMRLDDCAIVKAGTSASAAAIQNFSTYVDLRNTTFQFGNTGDSVSVNNGNIRWRNTPSAIAGATLPTTLFKVVFGPTVLDIEGVDLSVLGSGATLFAAATTALQAILLDCVLGASVTVLAAQTIIGARVDVVSSDSAATNYQAQRYTIGGSQVPETIVVRTSGASNGTTALSFKIATSSNAKWTFPFECQPISIWNVTTGTNRVVTLYGIWNAAALPNNDDIWIESEYLGSASSPQASFANNTKANNLATGSALTADSTSAWDSLVTARANTTSYTTASIIKVASNPGRVFFCTTGGTSAGSEPGGYASAVDGGSVTDGTAVFRAGVRFSMAVTLNSPQPAMAGPITVTVNAAKVSSTFYVDPLINLS